MRMRVFSFGGLALLAAVAVTLLSTPPPEQTRGLSLTSPPAAYAPSIASFVRTPTVLASAWEVRIPPSSALAGHDLVMAQPKSAQEGWGGHSIGGGSANVETEDGFITANGPRHHLLL